MGIRRTWRSSLARWLLGNVAIAAGALTGAFGALGWLTLLRVPSVLVASLGALFLGVVPMLVGLALIWAGLDVVSGPPEPVVRILRDTELMAAAHDGATPEQIAWRLAVHDVDEIQRRLDELVVKDELALIVTERGDLLYFATPRAV